MQRRASRPPAAQPTSRARLNWEIAGDCRGCTQQPVLWHTKKRNEVAELWEVCGFGALKALVHPRLNAGKEVSESGPSVFVLEISLPGPGP